MGKTVLLIEDEPNIIEAIRFLLKREGWKVYTTSDGSIAVQEVRQRQPNLVILDVMLPGKSGYDILRELRQEFSADVLPVLMLTARGQSKDRDIATQAGVSRFMTKPFSNSEMIEAVRALSEK
jgi:DNA-binding response OmpR family regulator